MWNDGTAGEPEVAGAGRRLDCRRRLNTCRLAVRRKEKAADDEERRRRGAAKRREEENDKIVP